MEPGKSLGRVRFHQEHDDWARLRVFQFLMVEDISAVADTGGGRSIETSAETSDSGRLSTIEEVSD
eukprot:7423501-Lingulodinium_polyedra.AAC.1